MNRTQKTLIKMVIASSALAIAAGCATTKQVEQAQAEAAEAKRMAQEANAELDRVRGMIQQALEAARAAQATADASQNCCKDLERKLDRALQDMQRK